MTNPLTPYMLWIKLAVIAVILAVTFGAGWTSRGWKCDAALKDAAEAALTAQAAAINDYKVELKKQETFKDQQRKAYIADKARLENRNRQLEEDIRNAPLNTVTARESESLNPDEPFNREYLRLWNNVVDFGNGLTGDPEARSDVSGADTSAARLTREDVLNHFKRVASLFRDCKMKQDKAIEFDRQQFQQGASP